jgi:hypothetical protein
VRQFWTDHFDALADPGHRFTYRDVLTGNLSLPVELWRQLGGLDTQFRYSREDYELGVRVLRSGCPIIFAPAAVAHHLEHETMSLAGAFRRAFQEGRMDAVLARKHPEVLPTLLLAKPRGTRRRVLEFLISGSSPSTDLVARALAYLLPVFDRHGLRGRYRRLFSNLRMYWYVRGLLAEVVDWKEFECGGRLTLPAPDHESAILDLREGLAEAEAHLDALRPGRVLLRFGSHDIGVLEYESGAEPWRGAHLRPQILSRFGAAYLTALALEGEIVPGSPAERAILAGCINRAFKHQPRLNLPDIWQEQLDQWTRMRSNVVDLHSREAP